MAKPLMLSRKPSPAEIQTAKSWPIWEKEPSSFDWSYGEKETCLILEGRASVKAADGSASISFGPGDWVVFEPGLKCVWTVEKKIRKHYRFG